MSTTTKNLGRVSIVPKGEWNSNNTYIRLDLVNYNGSSYIAKQNVPVNINLNNSNYWMLVASKGDKGDKSDFEGITEEQLEVILASYRTTIAQDEIDAAQNTKINKNIEDIATINRLIPVQANATNKLADKNFVNSSIQTNSAHFRGNWANWMAVPTNSNLYPIDDDGVRIPTRNDYMVIQDASDYPVSTNETALEGTWRFKYSGAWETNGRNGWQKEYQVNESPLTAEQLAALNSGATANLIAQIETNATNNTRQDASINNKQPKIMVNGILKGNGEGGVSAAVSGIDYLPTSALYAYRSSIRQDEIDNAQDTKINKNIDDISSLNDVVEILQPTATSQDIGKALIVKTVDSETGKPTAYEYGEAGGDSSPTLIAGDGISIANDIISNTQGIEYIVGTQTAATSKWTGVSKDETLKVGKIIAYYLPFAGTSTAATLSLTMANGSITQEIALRQKTNSTVTTHFTAGNIIFLIYDGSHWQVNASYDTDTNTYPTGYCITNGNIAAKTAYCTYGYRDGPNYFLCVFKNANTADNATLAITTYASEALPIYVNGERTNATNTFSAGVILFLFYNNAYYCYNDGRFPILVDDVVTSVQEYAETKYTKPSGGIPQTDFAQTVQNKLDKSVVISDTQPTEIENKLWLDTDAGSGTSYQIPTVAEMEAADAQTAAEIGIVITGKRPSMAVTAGQYVIVRNSTISGISDGLYTANTTLSPSTDVTAANLTAVSNGGLNALKNLFTIETLNYFDFNSTNFAFESWGNIYVTKCGPIVLVGVSGLKAKTAITSNTMLCRLPITARSAALVPMVHDVQMFIQLNHNDLQINSMTQGAVTSAQIAILTNF